MIWDGKERRRRILVERKVQLQYLTLIFASYLTVLILIEIQLYSFLKSILPKIQFATDHSYILGLGITIMVEMLVVVCIVGFAIAVHSQRIVGPIPRITREIDSMLKTGNYHHVQIRKKDYIFGLTEKINGLVDKVQK
ncbi:MAG: hypothetical protein A2252_09405 [Elusimicrobia bacterium RIFOXYA2_FULL_39_19]|nr:MAG: hypothetical protein A2252_09405 [Elusimicrobia bacterium RIFOXYA2_FULL_39_19]